MTIIHRHKWFFCGATVNVFHITAPRTWVADHVDQLIWWISDLLATSLQSAEIRARFFALDNCAMFPRSHVIGSTHCVMDTQTENSWTYLAYPQTHHSYPSFHLFAFGKKVVDGKNACDSWDYNYLPIRETTIVCRQCHHCQASFMVPWFFK